MSTLITRIEKANARVVSRMTNELVFGTTIAIAATAILSGIDGAPTRHGVLAAFQKRAALDVGGFRVAYDARRRMSVSLKGIEAWLANRPA